MQSAQLTLRFHLDATATFDNFYAADNANALAALQNQTEPFVHIWGESGTGKSHLLQAVCHAAGSQGQSAIYLPMKEAALRPDILTDLEQAAQIICVDDVNRIAGDAQWEQGVFSLFNRARQNQVRLITAADAAPAAMHLQLADLASRLSWGPIFRIKALNDEDKLAALRLRAGARGLQLNEEVGRFLLTHAPRDLHSLFCLLDRLDEASLRQQRRLTVPFVRQFL